MKNQTSIQGWVQTATLVTSIFIGGWSFHQKILSDIDARIQIMYKSFDDRVHRIENDIDSLCEEIKYINRKQWPTS